MDLGSAVGVLVLAGWLLVIIVIVGLVARAGRRRALRRGTYPLRQLPWYLGGPPTIDVDLPDDRRTARDRSRHP